MNEKALYNLSYGLFVLTANDNGFDNGCIINTAIQAASDPLTITVAVNKANYTTEMILKSGKFNVSVLSEKADFSMFEHFGFQSGRDCNKFENYTKVNRGQNGILYITENTNAYFLNLDGLSLYERIIVKQASIVTTSKISETYLTCEPAKHISIQAINAMKIRDIETKSVPSVPSFFMFLKDDNIVMFEKNEKAPIFSPV